MEEKDKEEREEKEEKASEEKEEKEEKEGQDSEEQEEQEEHEVQAEGEEEEEEEEDAEKAFWEMDDAGCDNTDYEGYECVYDYCTCKCPRTRVVFEPTDPKNPEFVPVPMYYRVEIEWWLSADMKFLLMILGLKGATSKFSCIYCKADLLGRKDS